MSLQKCETYAHAKARPVAGTGMKLYQSGFMYDIENFGALRVQLRQQTKLTLMREGNATAVAACKEYLARIVSDDSCVFGKMEENSEIVLVNDALLVSREPRVLASEELTEDINLLLKKITKRRKKIEAIEDELANLSNATFDSPEMAQRRSEKERDLTSGNLVFDKYILEMHALLDTVNAGSKKSNYVPFENVLGVLPEEDKTIILEAVADMTAFILT